MSLVEKNLKITGLNDQQVAVSRAQYGLNLINYKKVNPFFAALKSLAKEPMILLLFLTSSVYFITGNIGDGIFMASAIVLVATISLYQDSRSRNALEKLKTYTEPNCKVLRNGVTLELKSEELVVGDSMIVEEGTLISADGIIVQSNDFSVNESILTGESFTVEKDQNKEDNFVYSGTNVTSGLAIATVTAIGKDTKLGKIGKSLENIQEEKTPLEIQIRSFVLRMVVVGAIIFLIVWGINYVLTQNLMGSLLKALTLAMSILPEEIPVAFTTFMALGAWRLMKMGIVVKQMKTVETLGSATVICTDKTGTLTENKMTLAKIYIHKTGQIVESAEPLDESGLELIKISMWASEPIPFDPMEIALHDKYTAIITKDLRSEYQLIHEYPLGGVPPMMTHIHENALGDRIIAAKGAPEALINTAKLTEAEKNRILDAIKSLALEGYRVLGVGKAQLAGSKFLDTQQAYSFEFLGLVSFYDPPKKNINTVLQDFYQAGIKVRIVTGDNLETTAAIAKQIGFLGYEKSISGEQLMKMPESELIEKVNNYFIFSRMFPEAKLKIINALKAKGEIVAMTGDGVNDGPALKASHIGIAMGIKGTEIAKQSASLILAEDDLSKMVYAVAMGRKIYTNLKKAIQYIISIHIPIILTVFLPLVLGWIYPNILSPVHIIFLELIMGPTCSIIYENEPMERNAMIQKPRLMSDTFFNWRELATSIIQGLMITLFSLLIYQYSVGEQFSEGITRTMIFTVLVSANIFLTLVNRSFYYSIWTTLRYQNNLVPIMLSVTVLLTALLIYIKPLAAFFEFEALDFKSLIVAVGAGFISVIWYEIVKWRTRLQSDSTKPMMDKTLIS